MNPQTQPNLDLMLVNTPQFDYSVVPFRSYEPLPPLGLAYIATWLHNRGLSVELLDSEYNGLSPNAIAKIVNEKKPRFVGINLLTPTYHIAARILEGIDSEITVVGGGAHANALPMDVMNDPRMKKITFLVLEDGEFKLEGLLSGCHEAGHIPGVASRKNGKVIINPDQPLNHRWTPRNLDELPFVDRRFLETDPFYSEGRLEANIISSRGCPFNCSFCAGSYEIVKNRPRLRSAYNILEEVNCLYEKHGVTAVRFLDDLLLYNTASLEKMINMFLENKLNSHIVWKGNAHVHTLWNASDEMIGKLALSGCREIIIGIESGSQRILDYVNKKITPDRVRIVVNKLSQHGIRIYGYFVIGFPDETREEMRSTISLFHELREMSRKHGIVNQGPFFRGNIFEFRPYPQTIEWQRLLEKGFSAEELLGNYYPLVMNGLDERVRRRWSSGLQCSEVSPDEIQTLIRDSLLMQNEELKRQGVLPDFPFNPRDEDHDTIKEPIKRIFTNDE